VGLFKQRKNKQFNYVPRHKTDFDQLAKKREDDARSNIKDDWEIVRGQGGGRSKQKNTLPLLLVGLGMIIVLWYLLTQYETT